ATIFGCFAIVTRSAAPISSSSYAWCGCVPTEQNTSGKRSAIASTCACRRTRVEIVTMRPTPAARARATTASSSAAKSGKSRWQWLSMSIESLGLFLRLHIARENGRRRRKLGARRNAAGGTKRIEAARIGRDGQNIEKLRRRGRHERLRQDADLAEHLRGHVKDRALACGVGLGLSPRCLAGEIAVSIRHHGPDRAEHLVQLLRLHVLARDADQRIRRGE